MPAAFQADAFQNDAFQTRFLYGFATLYLFQRAVGVTMNKRAIIAGLKPRTFEITMKDKWVT